MLEQQLTLLRRTLENAFGVTWEAMTSPSRMQKHVLMRMLAVHFLKTQSHASMKEIAQAIGRDRVTVIYLFDKAQTFLETGDALFLRYHAKMLQYMERLTRHDFLRHKVDECSQWLVSNLGNPQFEVVQSDKHHFLREMDQVENQLKELTYK